MFSAISTIVALVFLAIAVFFIYDIVRRYRNSVGSMWDRILSTSRESATMVWGKFVLILSGVVANLDRIADLLNQPEMKTQIQTLLGNPRAVAGVMFVIGLITMLARLRTL